MSASLHRIPVRLRAAAWAIGGTAVVGMVLGVLAFSASPSRLVIGSAPSGARATFAYTAEVRPSAAYDGTTVRSPDPVFRRLVRTLTVSVSYHGAPATVALEALLATSGGWHSALPLTTARLDGRGTAVSVPLDLAGIDARAHAAAQATGIAESQVGIRLTATITRGPGLVFTPHTDLVLTPQQLTVSQAASLTTADPATVLTRTSQAETLGLPLLDPTVADARRLSELLLLAAALSGAVLGLSSRDAAPDTEADVIRHRHRRLLVAVRPGGVRFDVPVIEVDAFAALVAVAERSNRMVLHWTTEGVTTFVVLDDSAAYRYRTRPPDTPTTTTQRPSRASTASL